MKKSKRKNKITGMKRRKRVEGENYQNRISDKREKKEKP